MVEPVIFVVGDQEKVGATVFVKFNVQLLIRPPAPASA